jgi:hypothetical protein
MQENEENGGMTMKYLKAIMLALVLAAGISIGPVAGSSTIYVYHDIEAVSLEELTLAGIPCPDSGQNQSYLEPPIESNPLPSGSNVVEPSKASKPFENLLVLQSVRPMTGKELALAEASCPFSDGNLFALTIAFSDKSQIALSQGYKNSLAACSLETGLNKAGVMNACKTANRPDFGA